MVGETEEQEGIAKVKEIEDLWSQTGIIFDEDMMWLTLHARSFFQLGRISDDSWVRSRAEIFTKELEIEDLKRQLEEARGEETAKAPEAH